MPGETSGEVMRRKASAEVMPPSVGRNALKSISDSNACFAGKPLRSTVNDPPSSEENSFFVPERGPVLRSWLSQEEEDRKQDSGSDSEMVALGYLENIASRHA